LQQDNDLIRTWPAVRKLHIFNWLGLLAVLASGYWTVITYRDGRASELAQQMENHKKDAEARTKDQNSFVFQRQATLYFDAARSAATIANAIDPTSGQDRVVDAKTLQAERKRFEQLYWGELVVVEDRRVELAMIAFRKCLQKNGQNCDPVSVNQFLRNIDPELIKRLGPPGLLNFALELSACTRSALEKDRQIEFGDLESPLTVCPYD
jgi:hypothetical protein